MTFSFINLLRLAARPMVSLADTTFDHDDVRFRCCAWGWKLNEDDSDLGVARFGLDDGREVVFDSGKLGGLNGRACLWLVLCYWPEDEGSEIADCQDGPNSAGDAAGGGRTDFDERFVAAYHELCHLLGPPAGQGEFEYAHRAGWSYSYAVWRGGRGFLVLQQDEMDIQFGFDLSLWVLSARDGETLPTFPLTQ
jgi:hypothetical protein